MIDTPTLEAAQVVVSCKPWVDARYARLTYEAVRHHKRYARRVSVDGLTCQECGGAGGWRDVILDDGTGPEEQCGWCEGTGRMTCHARGVWLTEKRKASNKSR